MAIIDYFYYSNSPFSYLGHRAIAEIARKHGCGLAYKPVDLPQLWAVSGGVPLAKRPVVRQRYRLLELQRFSEFRGLPINTKPAYWPVDVNLADRCTIVLLEERLDPEDYSWRVMCGVWVNEENVADEQVLAGYLTDCGFDASSIISKAKADETGAILNRNSKEAVAAGALGVPSYVLNGEVFWGQDRIELIDHALTTGRAPFSTDIG